MGQAKFQNKFNELARQVESWLSSYVESLPQTELLTKSIAYCLQGGGKRIRPVLALATAEALGVSPEGLRPMALALELLHTSSLVHDDLPALDNDDLRRGAPTCHKQFGEATAILAGDMLIIEAFGVISRYSTEERVRVEWSKMLAEAGAALCRGQVLDLVYSKKIQPETELSPSAEQLEEACLQKTAALFRAAVLSPLPLLAPNKAADYFPALDSFGRELGLLFQISDDLLDASAGSSGAPFDYVAKHGREGAALRADQCVEKAQAALASLPGDFSFLLDLLGVIRERKS